MKTFVKLLLKNNGNFLIAVTIVTLFFSVKLGLVEMREDEETYISASSSVLMEYREFQKTFDANEGIVVTYESPCILSSREVQYLSKLHLKLEKLSGVLKVSSLINADNIYGVEGGIDIYPVIDTSSLNTEMFENAALLLDNNPLFEGIYLSKDQKAVALIIDMPGMFNGGNDSLHTVFYNELITIVREEQLNGRKLHLGGDIVTDASVEKLMGDDLALLFPLSLVFSMLILLIFFRKLVTTFVPLLPILIAILWVLGLKGWTGVPMTPISITLFPLIMVIGLANSIHIINHYQRVRGLFKSNSEAIEQTLLSVLKPCFLAAFTTAIGFGSLTISSVTGIKQMGIFAAFGIMAAFFLSITIIPFALKYSKAFNQIKQTKERKNILAPALNKIDYLNHKYSWTILFIFSLAIAIMVMFIPKIKVEGSMASFAKKNTQLRKDIRFIDENLSGINSYELIVTGAEDAFKNPEILKGFESLKLSLLENKNVLKVFSTADLIKTINKALHEDSSKYYAIPDTKAEVSQYLFLYEMSGGEELSDFVDETYSVARMTIRTKQMPNKSQKEFLAYLEQLYDKNLSPLQKQITGFGMLMNHINDNLISTQVESILLALVIIFVLMFIMFGFKGGLLSIFPNLFPIIFFMGLMGIFGIDLNMATSIIAAVTIGIVVDDTIHFFFGYKEEMQNLNNPSEATTNTINRVGSALFVTSLILTLGFGVLLFSTSKFISDFGIMSASAVASALLGDLFISPIALSKSKLFYKKA